MAEYIEREAALAICEKEYQERIQMSDWCGDTVAWNIGHEIKTIPAADVAPVRHGEWFVSIGKDGKPVGTICPICGFAWSEAIDAVKLEPCLSLIETAYCPGCGAKMNGGVE